MAAKIKKTWLKLAIKLRLAYFKKIIDNLKKTPPPIANPNPPTATLDSLYAAAAGTQTQIESLEQQVKSLRETRDSQVDDLAAAIDLESAAVIAGTGGDTGQIVAIGYDLASDVKTPVGPMTQVTTLVVTAGDNDGELNPTWDPTPGADNYEVQASIDPTKPAGWATKLIAPQSACIIPGLTSGVRHYVRVRAMGPLGPGPWSDEASKMVP